MNEQYKLGYQACIKNDGCRVNNPFAIGTSEAASWDDGWADAMDEIKDREE